jgi:glucose/arabinose dehydrogenase
VKRLLLRLGCLLAVLLASALVACALGLVPERYAVNAPIEQLLLGRGIEPAAESELHGTFRMPDGFTISLYASGLPNARFLRFSERGDLLVSTPRSGRIWLLARDEDHDGRSDSVSPLLEGLDRPHGLDFRDGWLYVAEGGAVRRVRYDATARRVEGALEAVVSSLPSGENHWTRTLRFGPDGGMYVSVGSSCNVCIEESPERATLLRFAPDGSDRRIYASGLRNSVGFDWKPDTGELYATDNGRDLLGDDVPPCEFNHVVDGGFYGWPFAYGNRVPDPDFGAGREADVARSIPPAHAFGAHNAPLGITFVRHPAAPASLRGAALVALHGSWNRTKKDGYRVVSLHWNGDGSIEEREFLSGFLQDERAIGRPVDVAEGPDGAYYVSDDYAGAVYRVAPPGAGTQATSASHAAGEVAPRTQPLAGLSESEVASLRSTGRGVYEGNACYRCHEAARADAGAVPVPLDRVADKYDVASLVAYLAAPQPPMPLFAMSDEHRRALAVYLLGGNAP